MLSSLSPEDLIPADHPIRRIRRVVDAVLADLDDEFEVMYASGGRPSVPPEQLLKATVLMALYSIRSERQFCERLNYDLLFKWFLGLAIDDRAFDASTFTKNRDRLLDHEIADRFFAAAVEQARLRRYLSSDHFSVDGTVLEAWASHKSFKPKDSDPNEPPPPGRISEADFHGEKRSNATHQSTTDPEARLYRKSQRGWSRSDLVTTRWVARCDNLPCRKLVDVQFSVGVFDGRGGLHEEGDSIQPDGSTRFDVTPCQGSNRQQR